jgi:predicted Fe-Mo cluster-binding NifX family protein
MEENKMKLCLPVTENNGINSPLSEHFGSAPYFIIVDTDTLDCNTIQNTNSHHAQGMCQPLAVLEGNKIDAIVVGGIGTGALNKLHAANIKVFKTAYKNVSDTVKAYKGNLLKEMTLDSTCSHNHGHSCGK